MKKVIIAIISVFALFGTVTVAHADQHSGNDYDIIRGRYNQDVNRKREIVINQDENGYTLSWYTNYELYNFKSEQKEYGNVTVIRRTWEPKWKASVINDANDYSLDNGNKVYNFDSYGYQLPQSTDFGTLSYIGHFQLKDGTQYRYWK